MAIRHSPEERGALVLAVDCGNTRIKWGLHEANTSTPNSGNGSNGTNTLRGPEWLALGVSTYDNLSNLAALQASFPPPWRTVICNVAGVGARAAVGDALGPWAGKVEWLVSSPFRCGVRNCYDRPAQLGADRWAALIGAWHRVGGPCLVVCAGTATTVDLLLADPASSGQGMFQGGVILPGYDLMRESLARRTAQLPLASGEFSGAPRNTDDAIISGCLNAQAGAVERMHRRLPTGAPILLAGGAAAHLAPVIDGPVQLLENLVLEGLLRMAAESL